MRRASKEEKRKRRRAKDRIAFLKSVVLPRFAAGLVTSFKRVGIQYTEDFGTTLPGYMDSTKILGSKFEKPSTGFGFIFGYQPDTNWINNLGNKGLLSRDTLISAIDPAAI